MNNKTKKTKTQMPEGVAQVNVRITDEEVKQAMELVEVPRAGTAVAVIFRRGLRESIRKDNEK